MANIYKIYNDINDKLYIGKTYQSVEKRFDEHCRDAKRYPERKFYKAMNEYGSDKFHAVLIEVVGTDEAEQREIYWIKYYNSFKNGYNDTEGGEGKKQIDYSEIKYLYEKGYNSKEISKMVGCCEDTCYVALAELGISKEDRQKRGREVIKHSIVQLDKKTFKVLNVFPSITEACASLGKQQSGHIADVCNGNRSSAYGYKWEYGD